MTVLIRKGQQFIWGPWEQGAFQTMKDPLCTAPALAYPNCNLPFILSTDASWNSLGAILSQVQHGLEKPLAYASRQTIRNEQSYKTSELEMLALIWATKQFRCYLHGRSFLAITNHSALTYLRKFADQNTRLLRWSIKLSGLDFIVEHKAASKMSHVDALSRHVGSVAHENTLDRVNILREQEKDSFCSKQSPGSYRSRKEFFLDSDDILDDIFRK